MNMEELNERDDLLRIIRGTKSDTPRGILFEAFRKSGMKRYELFIKALRRHFGPDNKYNEMG